jgi:PKD repeat protein
VTFGVVLSGPANSALPDTSSPQLKLSRTIKTTPFTGSSVSMKDNEGSAYVGRDNSLWMADDNGRRLYEVDATSGALKRTIDGTALESVTQYGGSSQAGSNRVRDLESLTYDSRSDTLYAFSGSCCTTSMLPTVFRLTRQSGQLRLDSYQPLPSGSDNTASAYNPGDGKLYVGLSRDIRTYSYTSNSFGSAFRVSNLSGILGMDFSDDGRDLYVSRTNATLSRVDWATRSLVAGWTFNLSTFGVKDSRGVVRIGDQFFVSDGYDSRTTGDPLKYAVFVFDVEGSTPTPTGPTASFTAAPTSGTAPLTVQFTDTSTGGPTSWRWAFGDGTTSTTQHPSHTYQATGTYTATLTATNSNGSSTASQQISVGSDTTPPPPPPDTGSNLIANPGFETGTSGWNTGNYATVSLTRDAGGHSGSYAAKLSNTGTTTVTNTLNDDPNTVATSSAGTYTGSIWLRSDSATAGTKMYLRIREYQGGTRIGEKVVAVYLTSSWQQVTGSYVPVSPGSSSIDFSAAMYSAPPGATYFADDASLTRN